MKNVIIGLARDTDLDSILALHAEFFQPISGSVYTSQVEEFMNSFSRHMVYVSRNRRDCVAFASYSPFHEVPHMKQSLQNALKHAHNKSSNLWKVMEECYNEIKTGEVVVEFYDSPFTQGDITIKDDNVYFSVLAVQREFQRQGIGEALVKRVIEEARILSAGAIYASCWEGGHSSKLLGKLGFLPIIKAGPRYNDGSAEKVMGLLL